MDSKAYIGLGFLIGVTIATVIDGRLRRHSDRLYCLDQVEKYCGQYGVPFYVSDFNIEID